MALKILRETPLAAPVRAAPIGVAKGVVFDNEAVWVAVPNELDLITCVPGGRCAYEAVFNLFPWASLGSDRQLLVTQLFKSFFGKDVVGGVADGDYGLSSAKLIELAQNMYTAFVGMYSQFATTSDSLMAETIALAERSNMYVQSFYDAEATIMSRGSVPQGNQLTELIRNRFDQVIGVVIASHGKIGADFVVNNGRHFKVYRMRDMVAGPVPSLEWHDIDAYMMTRNGSIPQHVFDRRDKMTAADTMQSLVAFASRQNPQTIAVVFRPKISRGSDNLQQWIRNWKAASNAGKVFHQLATA